MNNGTIGKVLIIDDELELKNILVESLTTQGYEVAGFVSATEALEALRQQPFDILLTDLMMPEMDGLAVMRSGLEIDPHLICIIMTGHGTIQTAVDAMKFGAFDYVLKPFRLVTLLPVLTRAMNSRRLRLENLQLRETVAIYELSQTIALTLDPQTIISKLADAALQQTDADEVSVLLPAEDDTELYVAAVRGKNRQRLLGERVPLRQGISSWVAHERQPLLLEGEVNDERFKALWPRAEIKSAISIPMQVASKLIGIININAVDRVRPFTLGQMKALNILASTAATALESAALYAQVERERQKLDNVVATVPGIVWEDRIKSDEMEQQTVFVSAQIEKMLGYTIDEWTSTPNFWSQVVHPDDRAEAEAIAAANYAKADSGRQEFRYLTKDGRTLWVESNYIVVRDDEGRPIGLRGVTVDISERRKAEEALRASEELYKALFDDAPVAYHEIDKEGRFTRINQTEQRLLGYTEGEMRSRFAWEFIADKVSREAVARKLKGKGNVPPQPFERTFIHKDGTRIPVEVRDRPLYDGDGEICGIRSTLHDITERKKAEAELRKLSSIVENSTDFIGIASPEGPVLFVNPTGQRMVGLDSDEQVRKTNLFDYVAEEDRERHENEILPIILRDGHWEGETLFRNFKTGASIPILQHVFLITEEEPNSRPVIATICRDITERKRAEEALRESEERYRDLVENAHDIIFSHDLEGNYTSVNRAGLEITGYTRQESLSRNMAQTVAPEFQEKAREMIRQKLAGKEVTSYEIEIIAKDGRRIPVEINTKLIYQDGVPVSVQGIARDITERKRAQAELTRLATAVEQTADSIVITDPQGNIEYVNPAFERVSGYSRKEVLGQNPRLLKSGKTDASVYDQLWKTITRGDVWEGQLTNRKKDGTFFIERASVSAVRDESGKIAHYVAVKKDISHETQLEDQLRQSQKMEAIGQLAGGVAHDFNNLLTAINGYSSLALQRIEPEHAIRNYLEEIKKAGDRAANLTRQLLAFGRKQILQPVPLSLNDIVTDMNKMLRRLIGEHIELTARLDPHLKTIKADPGQIEQVLMNLVVNARDAMPTGGSLTIETSMVEFDSEYASRRIGVEPGKYVMLAVSDTGTGMNEATRLRIFDPFFTTKEKGKGTGLGLSTVYGIVKQSGGNIWVYSEEGQGTTFKVYLPQMETAERIEASESDTAIPRGSEKILLLEDDDVVRGLTRQILESMGYQVYEAARGEEAIQLCTANHHKIDLLLTDVVMPEMSGKEVADRISKLKPSIKVLYMSGYTDEAIVHQGVLDSNVEFIQKPFTPAGLATKVREVLG